MSRMPSVGDVIDDVFRVDAELDHGNFGAVYKVTDLLEKQVLALKVLKPGPHDEEELRQRFDREARLIYSLNHPHIVRVFYYGETDTDLPYMAMEYLQGTDLKSLLRHHGGLSEALARRISIETLSALHTAHSMGIVHRDLKPGNIYLVNDGSRGHVKVLDFGFAKALESDDSREITNAGTLVGTPAYMSPELVHKRDVGPPADIYAMGLILAEMLTGTKVVQIERIYDTVMFQGADKPIRFAGELQDSPFYPILQASTAKDLDKRYETAFEMIEELRRIDLAGVGTFDEEVPLETAPPEVGDADPEVRTRPRSDGRPSIAEIDAELQKDDHPKVGDFKDDDPTVERQYSFEMTPATGASHTGSSPEDLPLPNEFEEQFEASPTTVAGPSGEFDAGPTNVERPGGQQESGPVNVRTSSGGFEPGAGNIETSFDRSSSTGSAESISPHTEPRRPPHTTPVGSAGAQHRANEAASVGMAQPAADAASATTAGGKEPSLLRDLLIGVVVGALMLGVILGWLHYF